MMDAVISGVGQSQIGRRINRDPLELTVDATLAAVEDAGLTLADIDGAIEQAVQRGWLQRDGRRIVPTVRGFDFLSDVQQLFLTAPA